MGKLHDLLAKINPRLNKQKITSRVKKPEQPLFKTVLANIDAVNAAIRQYEDNIVKYITVGDSSTGRKPLYTQTEFASLPIEKQNELISNMQTIGHVTVQPGIYTTTNTKGITKEGKITSTKEGEKKIKSLKNNFLKKALFNYFAKNPGLFEKSPLFQLLMNSIGKDSDLYHPFANSLPDNRMSNNIVDTLVRFGYKPQQISEFMKKRAEGQRLTPEQEKMFTITESIPDFYPATLALDAMDPESLQTFSNIQQGNVSKEELLSKLTEARSHGDLSENAEYQGAKEEIQNEVSAQDALDAIKAAFGYSSNGLPLTLEDILNGRVKTQYPGISVISGNENPDVMLKMMSDFGWNGNGSAEQFLQGFTEIQQKLEEKFNKKYGVNVSQMNIDTVPEELRTLYENQVYSPLISLWTRGKKLYSDIQNNMIGITKHNEQIGIDEKGKPIYAKDSSGDIIKRDPTTKDVANAIANIGNKTAYVINDPNKQGISRIGWNKGAMTPEMQQAMYYIKSDFADKMNKIKSERYSLDQIDINDTNLNFALDAINSGGTDKRRFSDLFEKYYPKYIEKKAKADEKAKISAIDKKIAKQKKKLASLELSDTTEETISDTVTGSDQMDTETIKESGNDTLKNNTSAETAEIKSSDNDTDLSKEEKSEDAGGIEDIESTASFMLKHAGKDVKGEDIQKYSNELTSDISKENLDPFSENYGISNEQDVYENYMEAKAQAAALIRKGYSEEEALSTVGLSPIPNAVYSEDPSWFIPFYKGNLGYSATGKTLNNPLNLPTGKEWEKAFRDAGNAAGYNGTPSINKIHKALMEKIKNGTWEYDTKNSSGSFTEGETKKGIFERFLNLLANNNSNLVGGTENNSSGYVGSYNLSDKKGRPIAFKPRLDVINSANKEFHSKRTKELINNFITQYNQNKQSDLPEAKSFNDLPSEYKTKIYKTVKTNLLNKGINFYPGEFEYYHKGYKGINVISGDKTVSDEMKSLGIKSEFDNALDIMNNDYIIKQKDPKINGVISPTSVSDYLGELTEEDEEKLSQLESVKKDVEEVGTANAVAKHSKWVLSQPEIAATVTREGKDNSAGSHMIAHPTNQFLEKLGTHAIANSIEKFKTNYSTDSKPLQNIIISNDPGYSASYPTPFVTDLNKMTYNYTLQYKGKKEKTNKDTGKTGIPTYTATYTSMPDLNNTIMGGDFAIEKLVKGKITNDITKGKIKIKGGKWKSTPTPNTIQYFDRLNKDWDPIITETNKQVIQKQSVLNAMSQDSGFRNAWTKKYGKLNWVPNYGPVLTIDKPMVQEVSGLNIMTGKTGLGTGITAELANANSGMSIARHSNTPMGAFFGITKTNNQQNAITKLNSEKEVENIGSTPIESQSKVKEKPVIKSGEEISAEVDKKSKKK